MTTLRQKLEMLPVANGKTWGVSMAAPKNNDRDCRACGLKEYCGDPRYSAACMIEWVGEKDFKAFWYHAGGPGVGVRHYMAPEGLEAL